MSSSSLIGKKHTLKTKTTPTQRPFSLYPSRESRPLFPPNEPRFTFLSQPCILLLPKPRWKDEARRTQSSTSLRLPQTNAFGQLGCCLSCLALPCLGCWWWWWRLGRSAGGGAIPIVLEIVGHGVETRLALGHKEKVVVLPTTFDVEPRKGRRGWREEEKIGTGSPGEGKENKETGCGGGGGLRGRGLRLSCSVLYLQLI